MKLSEFVKTKTRLNSEDAAFFISCEGGKTVYSYARNFFIIENESADKFSVVCEEFDTIEEAEALLYQMYCDEDRLSEGY